VVPILGISFALVAGAWYFIHRRRMIQKAKRTAKQESAKSFAEKEAARKRRSNLERGIGHKDDKAMRTVTDEAQV
jgi:hypothetical protein